MTSADNRKVHLTTTKAEALKLLRSCRARAHFRIHAACDGMLPADPEHYMPGAFSAGVQVSRGAAEMFVNDAFRETHEKRGYALKITISEGSRRSKWDDTKRAYVEYGAPSLFVWIG
jgi:hypothetical protein